MFDIILEEEKKEKPAGSINKIVSNLDIMNCKDTFQHLLCYILKIHSNNL